MDDDPGVRDRAAQDLAVEHAGDAHVAHVAGIAAELLVRVDATHRATHLGVATAGLAGRLDAS